MNHLPAAGPVGVVLAGGAGRRMGGAKASMPRAGRPLIAYPIAALRAVLAPVAVVAKRDSDLPSVGYRVEIWREPDEPRHPLVGIIEALRRADGRSVVVLACDLPMVTPDVIRALAEAPPAAAVLARAGDSVQPLCARFARTERARNIHAASSSNPTKGVREAANDSPRTRNAPLTPF